MTIKQILKMWAGILVCVLGIVFAPDAACAEGRGHGESINAFLDQYFLSWSKGDMAAYKNCFHSKATIVFLDRSNTPATTYPVDSFIRTQEEAHQKSLASMKEIPLDKQIAIAGNVSQATVRWKLFKGDKIITGVDLFTLVLTSGKWKILHLTVRTD